MIKKPMDVLTNYEVRKSKKQKTAFISAVTAYAVSLRYSAKVEKGNFGCRNIVIGDAKNADYLITAHYDTCAWMALPNLVTPFNLPLFILYQFLLAAALLTAALAAGYAAAVLSGSGDLGYWSGMMIYCMLLLGLMFGPANRRTANDNTSGVVTLLEIMASLPDNCRGKVAFVLFDLEEAGLIGSSAYRKAHKAATDRQIVLNMDCVGDGDEIVLIPCKKLCKQESIMLRLNSISGKWGRKSLSVHKNAMAIYPSDQMHFPKGVAVAAFHHKKYVGHYYGRIHTHRDTVLDQTNVNFLRAALISLVSKP